MPLTRHRVQSAATLAVCAALLANGIKKEIDAAAQIKMIEQAVAQKAQAIVLAPADSKTLVR